MDAGIEAVEGELDTAKRKAIRANMQNINAQQRSSLLVRSRAQVTP
jgi:hypothetical protein